MGRGGEGFVVCDIFLIGGQPRVTVCVRRGKRVKFGQKKSEIFFEWPLTIISFVYCTLLTD